MSLTTSNLTSGFIDLATFDEIERYLYGTLEATAYFVRETRKSTWFTQVPVVLSNSSGTPQFGQDWSVSVSRAGDYLLHTWLRVTFPAVGNSAYAPSGSSLLVRWSANLMHNLIRECNITFNDLVAARFDNYHLDFWAAFTVPANKQVGYNNMIGNVSTLTLPTNPGGAPALGASATGLPAATLNLPIPLFYTRDSGVALPTAALPYNEMRINFSFRDWTELLILENPSAGALVDKRVQPSVSTHVGSANTFPIATAPVLSNVGVWANYAIVSNDERKRMACAPRDILIEQVQTAPRQTFAPVTNNQPSYDIRFSHAIKALFFAARNRTFAGEWSIYGTASPQSLSAGAWSVRQDQGYDPIAQTSLVYENTARLSQMGSDYFSLVNPWYHAPSIPEKTGLHCYSYSLDFYCLDPMGSTNYGKLTNVSIRPEASAAAQASVAAALALGTTGDLRFNPFPQSYDFIVTVINNNIIRVSGGALGFPVL
jgi:hypothetical protein